MSIVVDPLRYLESELVGDEGGREALCESIEVGPILPGYRQHITEAHRSDESTPAAALLEQRIRGRSRTVGYRRVDSDAEMPEALVDGEALIARRRRLLVHDHLAIHEPHEIGERASDVDADELRRFIPGRLTVCRFRSC